MALELVLPLIADLVKEPFKNYIFGPVARHISYAFKCDIKVEALQHQVENLNNKRLRLQQFVDDATRNGEEIYPDVTTWLTTAGKEIEDAEKLIQEKAKAMNKCFLGLCPNLKTRYQLSKKSHKKALAVGKQLQDAEAIPDPISFRPPLQPIVEPSVYSSDALPSRVRILNQVMDALKDPKLNMIGVYGMGGVGKTTLAKELKGKTLQEKKLFETVVMVAVSQTPNLRRIQGEIADALGLTFDVEGVPGRAFRLHRRLEKAKVLIILDDVWQKLDLNDVGVPYGDAYEGCKILLTSRRKEVLCNEMRTQKEFSLEVLEKEEGRRLFEMSVSNITDPELHGIATEIAKKCAGLPLLILKVAADLRGKESFAWKDMSKRLSSLQNSEIYEKVHKVIESSYENLVDVEAKSLFLLCALFGESNLSIHSLLMYSVGLCLFNRINSIEEARNRVLTLINKLKDECLLLDSDKAGFVNIHDVVREIAPVMASRVQNAFVGAGKVRLVDIQSKDYTRISLPYCDISELPEVLEYSEAEVFSFFTDWERLDIPSSFFEGVPKLKVVDFTGLHFVSGLPSSLGFLRGLRTLCLQRCEFDNVAIVAGLKQLELLSFANSNIKILPEEIKGLTRLKLLDLRDCYYLQVIPANVLSNLSLLEELYILNSFDEWEADGNASLEELKNLSHLKTLEIQVKDGKLLPEDWFFGGVQNYRISIGEWRNRFGNQTSRRILKLELKRSIGSMHRIKEFVRGIEVLELSNVKGVENLLYDFGTDQKTFCGSFGKLQVLKVYGCDTLKSLFSHSFAKYLPLLQELEVDSCRKMEAIAGEGCEDEVIEFTQLTSLELTNLPNLQSLCKTSGMVSFPSLTKLEINKCNGLKSVFTNSMVKSLEQLEQLEIFSCESMEEIILTEEIEEGGINRMVFPKLDILQLRKLEELKNFGSRYPIDFPSLKNLYISGCGAIDNFVSKFINRSQNNEGVDEYLFNEMVTFTKLEDLYMNGMDQFKYVFHASCNLPKLRELQVHKCYVEVIFANAKDETTEIELPDLTHVKVSDCYNLISISASNSKVTFPNLEDLSLDGMDEMEYVFPASEARGLLQLQKLKINNCAVTMIIANPNEETIEIEWPKLTRLEVSNCYYLVKFSSNNSKVTFPCLKYLSIIGCDEMEYVFPASVACCLLQLQKIEIQKCGVEVIIASDKEEAVQIEWPSLTHLKVLHCENLIKFSSNNSKVSFPGLRRLQITHSNDLKYVFTNSMVTYLEKLKELEITNCESIEEIILSEEIEEESINKIKFSKLDLLELRHLKRLKRFSRGHPIDFPLLRVFNIYGCDAIEILVSKGDDNESVETYLFNEMVTFSNLEYLYIAQMKHLIYVIEIGLPSLTHLEVSDCRNLISISSINSKVSFPCLTILEIRNCNGLKFVLTNSMIRSLKELEQLKITLCASMEEIILTEEVKEGSIERMVFPELDRLQLENLKKLKRFSSGHPIDFPSLRKLRIDGCDDIENLVSNFMNRRNDNEGVDEYLFNEMVTFPNLEDLYIYGTSDQLKHVFHASCVLPQLRELKIHKCGAEVIFANAKDETIEIEWPNLTRVKVSDCYNLISISASNSKVIFPNLEDLSIDGMDKMEYVFPASVARGLLQLRKLKMNGCGGSMIIANAKEEQIEIEWPSLTHLKVSNCDKLIKLSSNNSKVSFPSITKLEISNCSGLKYAITN